MIFEHFGINVPDARAMAKWYVENLNMQIVHAVKTDPYAHFLADETGRTIIEIYTNTNHPIPDYASQHPSMYHFAVKSDDPTATKDKLVKAGATFILEETLDDGSFLIMLRDPWDIPLQLARRSNPMP